MSEAAHAVFYPLLGCNARCPFCSSRVYTEDGIVATSDYLSGSFARGLGESTIGLEEAKERYQRLKEGGVKSVSLQGGEPTIWPWLRELIEFGKTIGIPEQIVVTNGIRLADAEYAAGLSRSGVKTIALSIFGAKAATHDHSLGTEGAFDAMVQAARNLAAVRPAGACVTAQLLLHAYNVGELEEMLSFWYAQGIRDFSIRLLREVPNVAGENGRSWFFDPALLKPELSRALRRSRELPGVGLVFPEIFYCLLGADEIGFVLGDLSAARRISGSVRVEARRGGGGGDRRRLPMAGQASACDDCDLDRVCAKLEEPYASLCSLPLRAIDIEAEVRALVSEARGLAFPPSLDRLLDVEEEELSALGLLDLLAPLRPKRGKGAALRTLAAKGLEDGAVVRFLSLSDLGARTRFFGDPWKILADLHSMAPPSGRDKLVFLRKNTECIHIDPLFLVFSGRLNARGEAAPFWVIVFDDERVSQAEIEPALSASSFSQKP